MGGFDIWDIGVSVDPDSVIPAGPAFLSDQSLQAIAYAIREADRLGLELENLDAKKAKEYEIPGGVVVKTIRDGGLFAGTRMEKNFIITTVNGQDIKNADDLGRYMNNGSGRIQLEGIYPGYNGTYTYQVKLPGDDGG